MVDMQESPLLGYLRGLISENGPITLGTYMALCLGHPQHGYYMSKEPFGAHGDFTTAPEISQLFGEMIAVWLMTKWQELGQPEEMQIIELGPGRGTLMKDVWRGLSAMPALRDLLSLHLVEFSPRLRQIQSETLEGLPVTWHTDITELPQKPSFIIANEFFDALPVEQAVYHDGHWYQRLVTGDDEDLIFTLGKPLQGITADNAEDGAIYEYAPQAAEIMVALCEFLELNGGALLAVDYGDSVPLQNRMGDTVQALHDHKPIGIFDKPGQSDITAHVSFAALEEIAADMKATNILTMTQREFLTQYGIRLRAEKLIATANDNQHSALQSGLHRLVDPTQMGDLFKVLQVTYGL